MTGKRKASKTQGRKAAGRAGRRPPGLLRRGVRLLRWFLVAAIWGFVLLGSLLAWYAYDLPDVDRAARETRRPSITLIAADGSPLASTGEVYGRNVSVAELPAVLPQAVLAVEDRRFYSHWGIDLMGLARAMWVNLKAGEVVQGGSTITQQLAKVLFLTPERTLERKVQEALLALWLETKFSKDEILSLYLNRVYLGAGSYGVDAAARRYYDKPASEVSLYEAAQLAGLLKAPSRYNPVEDYETAGGRTRVVLNAMVEAGFISGQEALQAMAEKPGRPPVLGRYGRYYADWILAQIGDFVGRVDHDLTVVTSLDPGLQVISEAELAALLEDEGAAKGVGQAAVVVLAPDGAVRALVGGRDYTQSQFNRATQARRQPGSAFKPFIYLAAFEAGRRPDQRILDGPVEVDGWRPRNYADRYYGEVTLREAFARSLNSVAVRLSEETGRERVAEAARRLGITVPREVSPSIALGTSEVSLLQLTGAYTAFANGGRGAWPYGIVEIRDTEGRLLYRRGGGGPGQVIDGAGVDLMNDMMTATVAWGTGKAARIDRPSAGKTGTSQGFRDAWFVGYTRELVAGVWVGNDDETPMQGVTGGGLPARLWARIVGRALADRPPQALARGAVEVAANGAGEGFLEGLIRRLTGSEIGAGGSEASGSGIQRREIER